MHDTLLGLFWGGLGISLYGFAYGLGTFLRALVFVSRCISAQLHLDWIGLVIYCCIYI